MKQILTISTSLFMFFICFTAQGNAQNEPPTAHCRGNTVVTPVYEGQTRTIHAEKFNKNSYDDNTSEDDLRFAFSADLADSLLTIDCDSPDSMELNIYVFDEEGEYSYCTTKLNIDDQCDEKPIIVGTTDTVAPVIFLVDEMALSVLDSVSFNTIEAKDFNAGTYDNISDRSKLRFTFSEDPMDTTFSYHCDDKNEFHFTIYVTDEAGNRSFCNTSITIDTTNCSDGYIVDTIPPVVNCVGEISLELEADGDVELEASDVDNGSYDGDHTTPVDRLRFSFDLKDPENSDIDLDCDDVGESTRTLYVFDHEGNVDSCTFTLTLTDPLEVCDTVVVVVDTIPPIPECKPLIELSLQGDTTITIDAEELDNGSTDNMTASSELDFSFSADTDDDELTLSCKDLGVNQVTLFVTDSTGNSATCISVISLSDPDELCKEGTAVTQVEDVEWTIYPNPVSHGFTLENLPIENGTIHLVIYDVHGRKTYSREIRQSKVRIQSDLIPGNYFLKLTQNGKLIGQQKITKN